MSPPLTRRYATAVLHENRVWTSWCGLALPRRCICHIPSGHPSRRLGPQSTERVAVTEQSSRRFRQPARCEGYIEASSSLGVAEQKNDLGNTKQKGLALLRVRSRGRRRSQAHPGIKPPWHLQPLRRG